jgi:septal ring factor EnvC (AmiA/AmiB activator)
MLKFAQSLNCKEFTFTLEKKRSKRSNEQNRYYWGVVVPLVKQGLTELGYIVNIESTHDFIKSEFNYKEIVNQNTGEIKKLPNSTTQLTKTEFSDMIERVKQWASEWCGIYIPDAGEQIIINY